MNGALPGILNLFHNFLGDLCEESSFDHIINLQEYRSELGFSDRIIFGIEFIESLKCLLVRVHIQCIDRQCMSRHSNILEDFFQSLFFSGTSFETNCLWFLLQFPLNKSQQMFLWRNWNMFQKYMYRNSQQHVIADNLFVDGKSKPDDDVWRVYMRMKRV